MINNFFYQQTKTIELISIFFCFWAGKEHWGKLIISSKDGLSLKSCHVNAYVFFFVLSVFLFCEQGFR